MKLPRLPQEQPFKNPLLPLDQVLLYHTVLISAANLIPFPFIDDFVVQKIRQNMVKELGKVSGDIKISSSETKSLTMPYQWGCSTGCLFFFTHAIKKFFEDIFFWLEIQHSVSLLAETYCYGYLLAMLFSSKQYKPRNANIYGTIIQGVISKTNLALVKNAISSSLVSAKEMLKSISNWLIRFFWFYIRQTIRISWMTIKSFFLRLFGRKLPDSLRNSLEQADLKDFLEDKSPNIHQLIDAVTEQFLVNLKNNLIQQYLDSLKDSLFSELSRAGL